MSNKFKGPSGTEYLFHKNCPSEVKNKEDVAYFLRCGNGKFFVEDGKLSKIKDKIKAVVTGKPSPDRKSKILSEDEIYNLNAKEQRELIRKLGGGSHRVPRLEKDRVKLIVKLQGGTQKNKSKPDSDKKEKDRR